MSTHFDFSTSSAEDVASREGEAEFPSGGDISRRFFIVEAAASQGDGGRLFTFGSLECSGEEHKSTM
jgi:hypothetical protein